MPSGDYTSAVGGALKIKGVQGSKVDKHNLKKKKKKPKNHREDVPETSTSKKEDATVLQPATKAEADEESRLNDILAEEDGKIEKSEPVTGMSKTETERRFDERRRKTLNERLKREGVKTHKERVEGYNRYLSSLSEHHDMPRIGPG